MSGRGEAIKKRAVGSGTDTAMKIKGQNTAWEQFANTYLTKDPI